MRHHYIYILGPIHSQVEPLSDSWARLKHSRDWLYTSSSFVESDFDLSRSLGVHTLIENVVSFVSGDVGNSPGFKEPEESMSTSPQASIIAMEQQQLRAEVSFSLTPFTSLHTLCSSYRFVLVGFVFFF